MARNDDSPLHIGVLPWLAAGHLTPFIHLSVRLAHLGHRVSFLSTPSNLHHLPSPLPPNLHPIPLPPSLALPVTSTAGLSDSDDTALRPCLRRSFDSLSLPLSSFLRSSSPPVDWLLSDYSPFWAPQIAKSSNAKSAFISLFNAAFLSFLGPLEELLHNTKRPQPEDFTVAPAWVPFETSVAFSLREAKAAFAALLPDDYSGVSETNRFGASIRDCDVVAVRSCIELEGAELKLLGELYKKPVFPLGHFPPAGGGEDSGQWAGAFEWLDGQAHGSVVYVAFGSEVRLKKEEVYEIARGLELSGLPFIWALRRHNGMEEEESLLPDGFESRISGRGIVCLGWVPQLRFLSHPAVGGFLTHCGWNSLVEGLQFGLALILMPMIFDQGLNARLLAERGIGKEVPRDEEDGRFDGTGIAKTLRLIMVEEEGEPFRAKAKEQKSVLGHEVQDSYVKQFVEYLKENRPIRSSADASA